MKKGVYYVLIVLLCGLITALFFYSRSEKKAPEATAAIPSIGSIELLNGCGIRGAATAVRDYLREKGFDVKKVEDAPDWNYRETVVVSRTRDMSTANMVGKALHTGNVTFIRNDSRLFDVTLFIGRDYQKLIK